MQVAGPPAEQVRRRSPSLLTPPTHPIHCHHHSSLPTGPAYYDFIASRGLPVQMAEVDPIIASHAGGVVGIMTAQLMNGGSQRRR